MRTVVDGSIATGSWCVKEVVLRFVGVGRGRWREVQMRLGVGAGRIDVSGGKYFFEMDTSGPRGGGVEGPKSKVQGRGRGTKGPRIPARRDGWEGRKNREREKEQKRERWGTSATSRPQGVSKAILSHLTVLIQKQETNAPFAS